MMTGIVLYVLIPAALLCVLGVLGLGIYSLARGGDFSKKHGNKLMRLRVAAQAGAVALLALFLILIGKGPG